MKPVFPKSLVDLGELKAQVNWGLEASRSIPSSTKTKSKKEMENQLYFEYVYSPYHRN